MHRRSVLMSAVAGTLTSALAVRYTTAAQATPEAIPPFLMAYNDAWSSDDPDQLTAFFTPDAIYEEVVEGGIVAHGADEIRAYLADVVYTQFPDFQQELVSGFMAEGWAALEWIVTGTHTGDLLGFPATGMAFSVPGSAILQLEGELIRRDREYFDQLSLLSQLGLYPEPEATPSA
jgi:steroid delta-isomerase-like uncharacterized protein